MIIKAFATYLQSFDQKNENIPSIILLSRWLRDILDAEPKDNVQRVVHHEISIAKNNIGMFIIHAKGKSGRVLLESLYNFALSYEQQKFTRWVHRRKADDFNDK